VKSWYGKLIGFVAGVLLLRGNPLFGAVLGLLVGHAFDAGWLRRGRGPGAGGAGGGRHRAAADDPYRVLGVAEHASDAEVDLAYRRGISQVHPDRFDAAEPGLRRQAEARARELNAAYDRIRSLRRRS